MACILMMLFSTNILHSDGVYLNIRTKSHSHMIRMDGVHLCEQTIWIIYRDIEKEALRSSSICTTVYWRKSMYCGCVSLWDYCHHRIHTFIGCVSMLCYDVMSVCELVCLCVARCRHLWAFRTRFHFQNEMLSPWIWSDVDLYKYIIHNT